MVASVKPSPAAWQPLTPRGVASFASATWGRLFFIQICFALMAGGAAAWCVNEAWFGTIRDAIAQMPEQGAIRVGELDWQGTSPIRLAEGRFLSLAVDLDHEGDARSPAHVQVEFGRRDVHILSLFGYLRINYPVRSFVAFNRTELGPWWGAWAPAILALCVLGVASGLMVTWFVLSAVYMVPVWLLGLFANRDLKLFAAWRLSGAALMPGAVFQTVGIVCYGLGAWDPVHLLVITAIHLVIGWGFLLASLFTLRLHPEAEKEKLNPFLKPTQPDPPESLQPPPK